MKKMTWAAVIALAAPAAAFAKHDTVGLIGTVVRECHDTYWLQLEDDCKKVRITGDVCHLTGKRVEAYGRLERGILCATALHELLPRANDLVVAVDVTYGGRGEAFVGYQRAGDFDRSQVRFARRVSCGDSLEVRVAVRADEARCGARYQVVMFAEEKARTRCHLRGARTSTVVRHELSRSFRFERGRWDRGCNPRVELCL
jgi:RNase P/RNase MRP subunit p29